MKKLNLIIIVLIFAISGALAQSPQAFKYQAVARDASGDVLQNQNVSMRISILQGSSSGTSVYKETHSETTNDFGLINLEIGNGTPVSGTFSSISWGTNDYFVKIEMDANGGTSYQHLGTSQLLSVPYALYAENTANGSSQWSQNGNDIYYNDGYVGIGTTNSGSSLTIKSQTGQTENLLNLRDESNNSLIVFTETGYVGIGTTNPLASLTIKAKSGQSDNLLNLRDNSNNVVVVFKQTGNVGIGTTNPTHKLSVNGTIRSKEVIVNTGWSDFVFEPDYNLPTLNEVEQFIQVNGRLMDMPSAEEVEKNGVSIGNISSKLLQKIEELTLYTIDQEKEIENLQQENTEQNITIENQQQQIDLQNQQIQQLLQQNQEILQRIENLENTNSKTSEQ